MLARRAAPLCRVHKKDLRAGGCSLLWNRGERHPEKVTSRTGRVTAWGRARQGVTADITGECSIQNILPVSLQMVHGGKGIINRNPVPPRASRQVSVLGVIHSHRALIGRTLPCYSTGSPRAIDGAAVKGVDPRCRPCGARLFLDRAWGRQTEEWPKEDSSCLLSISRAK
jgi:hypothetical protein